MELEESRWKLMEKEKGKETEEGEGGDLGWKERKGKNKKWKKRKCEERRGMVI